MIDKQRVIRTELTMTGTIPVSHFKVESNSDIETIWDTEGNEITQYQYVGLSDLTLYGYDVETLYIIFKDE